MPVSSISGMTSTSVYFASVFLLMIVIMGPASSAYKSASAEAAQHVAAGIATQIDDLSPGMKTSIEFGSYPGMAAAVTFSGSSVTATVNGFSSTQTVRWELGASRLSPGQAYEVALQGGVVTLA